MVPFSGSEPLDGEGNSLAVFVQTHDDELPWTLFPGDPGRFDFKLLDVAAQKFCLHDSVHRSLCQSPGGQ